ncbi:VapC toxin family PIN domain ribonuclease [Geodermatophilus sp. TF02-6]|uniref:TA system VapC family ribonuclease toxin n=1 Tax=Geodermatophilus sp. TF02-6 TaxID=2250575 RepID=UPI000DE8D6BD|nr:TA system VapC family ribonuclease toxin [Geodermatophilus sp. TF02-6]RBY80920.1 VapC toxin family PIN domain ribonuclease [Geodermatophilus sp. TF02-6]
MLVDANLLLYAVSEAAPQHDRARVWWEETLNGSSRVGLPWQTIGAFVRIATHPRVARPALTAEQAWSFVADWLDVDLVWVPPATERTAAVLGSLLRTTGVTGNLVPDAQLAALAIEHGLGVASADSDFVLFPGVRWSNPLG